DALVGVLGQQAGSAEPAPRGGVEAALELEHGDVGAARRGREAQDLEGELGRAHGPASSRGASIGSSACVRSGSTPGSGAAAGSEARGAGPASPPAVAAAAP